MIHWRFSDREILVLAPYVLFFGLTILQIGRMSCVLCVAFYGLRRNWESIPPICPVHSGVLAYSSFGIFPVGNPVSVHYYLLWL